MNEDKPSRRGGVDSRAPYLIRVQGSLDAGWIDYFDGISIVVSAPEGELPITTICAHDSDQAALLGVLNALYDFGFPLLYLQRLDDEPEHVEPGIGA